MSKKTFDPESLHVGPNKEVKSIMTYIKSSFTKKKGYQVTVKDPGSMDKEDELTVRVGYGNFSFLLGFDGYGFGVMTADPESRPFITERDLSLEINEGGNWTSCDYIKKHNITIIVLSVAGNKSRFLSEFDFKSDELEQSINMIRACCERSILFYGKDHSIYFGAYIPGGKDHDPELSFLLTPENCEEIIAKYKQKDKLAV